MSAPIAKCRACDRTFDRLAGSGNVPGHGAGWQLCPGSYQPPAELRPLAPAWMADATAHAIADLRNLAARYPDRFEWRDGKLYPRRGLR